MSHEHHRKPTLYELLGLDNFAPCFEVNERKVRFESILDESNIEDQSQLSLAVELLSDPESKQRYDLLLEALLREDLCLAPVLSSSERLEIMRIAARIGISLEQKTETVFRVVSSRASAVPAIPSFTCHSVLLGLATIQFIAVDCEVELSPLDYRPILVSQGAAKNYLTLSSKVTNTVFSVGDKLQLVTVGNEEQPIGYHAAYINESKSAFGVLEAAPEALFDGGSSSGRRR